MQIELSITARKIVAENHVSAKSRAYHHLISTRAGRQMLVGLSVTNLDAFVKAARSFREADGSFTVTIP